MVSTAASMSLVVLSEYGCSLAAVDPVPSNCASSRGSLFSLNSSSTWDNIGDYGANADGVGLGASLGYKQYADFGLDTVGLGLVNGTDGPVLKSQIVGGIATVSPIYLYIPSLLEFLKRVSDELCRGIFGLNPQPLNFTSIGNSSAPSYFQSLRDEDLIPSLSWSYTAGAKYRRNI